jgi:hypothetical protein
MAENKTCDNALYELRLKEEVNCRRRVEAAERSLGRIRLKIAAIEESMAKCSRQAAIAFRHGNETVGRGNQREVQGLTLLRARTIGHLAEVKARLAEARQKWQYAAGIRRALGLTDEAVGRYAEERHVLAGTYVSSTEEARTAV